MTLMGRHGNLTVDHVCYVDFRSSNRRDKAFGTIERTMERVIRKTIEMAIMPLSITEPPKIPEGSVFVVPKDLEHSSMLLKYH